MAFTTVSGTVPSVPSVSCQERSPVLPKLQSSASSFSTTWRSGSSLQRLPNFLEQKLQAVRPPARTAPASEGKRRLQRGASLHVNCCSADDIMRKWGLSQSSNSSGSKPATSRAPQAQQNRSAAGLGFKKGQQDSMMMGRSTGMGPGLLVLLLLNIGLFLLDHVAHVPCQWLYLQLWRPQWYQFVTSAFFHISFSHISNNIFFLYIFGRIGEPCLIAELWSFADLVKSLLSTVEEEEGALGLWLTYLVTAIGGNFASWLSMPHNSVCLGASGAVFGLFAVAVLLKISLKFTKLLEMCILGQFVVQQVYRELQDVIARTGSAVGGTQVAHIAHLGGALMGVLLVVILSRLPKAAPRDNTPLQPNSPASA